MIGPWSVTSTVKTFKTLCWPKGKAIWRPTPPITVLSGPHSSSHSFMNTGQDGREARAVRAVWTLEVAVGENKRCGGPEGSCWLSTCRAPDVATGHRRVKSLYEESGSGVALAALALCR